MWAVEDLDGSLDAASQWECQAQRWEIGSAGGSDAAGNGCAGGRLKDGNCAVLRTDAALWLFPKSLKRITSNRERLLMQDCRLVRQLGCKMRQR